MNRHLAVASAILAAAFTSSSAFTQTPPTSVSAVNLAGEPSHPDAMDIEPAALSALERMTLYLGTLKRFEVRAVSTIDEVMETGQKLQFEGGATYRVQRPNAFFIETRTDRRVRQFFYDGKTFTMFSPRMGLYTQISAPDTITKMLDVAESEYDIAMPLAELFRWGASPSDMKALTSALHIGFARIHGSDCDQYAFRQEHVDWQVWIQRGDMPLPRKLVITTRDDSSHPQYAAVLDWDANAKLDAKTFDFKPPAEAHQVKLVRVSDTAE